MFIYLNRLLSKSLDAGDAFHVVLCALVAKQLLYPVSQLLTDLEGRRGHHNQTKTQTQLPGTLWFIIQPGKIFIWPARQKNNNNSPSPNGRLFILIRILKSRAGSTLPTWRHGRFLSMSVQTSGEVLYLEQLIYVEKCPTILTEVTEPSAMSARL